MKKPSILLLILAFILIAIPIIWILFYYCGDMRIARGRFEKQLGTYVLDIYKTDLGIYKKDIDLYKDLKITFKADSTFIMNLRVPFIFDSIGRWEAGGAGLEDWNWMYYKSNKKIRTQFDQCCLTDSTFYMNSTTPQQGHDAIGEIYFKKIR